MRAVLIGVSEAVQGQIYWLDQLEVSIGRAAANTLRIPHSSISREHCLIRAGADRIEVRDRASHNGTYVNGLPVHDRVLVDGDELTLGAVAFLFRTLEPGT